MQSLIPTIRCHDGQQIPQIGLGVWRATNAQSTVAVREALLAGYRHIDTAAIYQNETGVGAGIRESGLPREDIFVTTKVWNDAHGKSATRRALAESLEQLGLDYVNLLLIHWPVAHRGLFVETWQTLIELQQEGLVRSIGVSNFTGANLQTLKSETGVMPVLNQIELHPYLQQQEMRDVHAAAGIVTECWSPLAQNQALHDPAILRIAAKYGKTTAQVIIRWHVQMGFVVIPKSVHTHRIRENIDVFDFTLDDEDMTAIAVLDRNERLGPDPETFG